MVVIKKSGEGYILTVSDENGFCWDQALTKEELLEIQKILNQKFKHEYKI